MADTTALKNRIRAALKANNNQEITGPVLQQTLLDIVDELDLNPELENEAQQRRNGDTTLNNLITGIKNNIDNGYVYAGIATPSTVPVSGKAFYVAVQAGTYTNFGGTAVTEGITILKYNGASWVKEQALFTDGGVFDISAYHATGGALATYADLTAALGTNGENIPQSLRKGGMSVKFVQSSDNKYVQYRLMSDSFGTIESDWQNIGLDQDARIRMTEIYWSDLKQLRDNGQLIPGMQYRITDYDCYTTQKDTQSAAHQFDIIVTADSTNKLNEVARAIQHEAIHHEEGGDEYFSNCNLAAWKIWYCLDNDTKRFAWADETDGKGVIYRMIDEHGNDCPYDFKNIQFKRYKITKANQNGLVGTYLGLKENNAKGIEIDANDNIWCYTFTAQVAVKTGDNFVIPNNAPYIDGSLESPYRHMSDEASSTYHDNKIGSYLIAYDDTDEVPTLCGKYYLPDNVFIGYFESTTNAAADDYCYAYCSYNITLDNNCRSNSFGNNCSFNSFGNDCNYNSFGNNCSSNSFGNDCCSNSFGNDCNSNSFGNSCNFNSFGNDYCSNSFGNDCNSNSFGNSCNFNSFGNGCSYNSFGNNCNSNSFGNGCNFNSFGNDCNYNSFGNNCNSNSFGNGCNYNSFGNGCYNNKLNDYYTNNKFENKVTNIKFSGTGTGAVEVRNYHIKQGITFANLAPHTITAKIGLEYELTVAKQSDGTVVEYCEADLLKSDPNIF